MPIVRVTLMEGRPPDRIEAMIVAVSEAIATTLDAPIESVRVMVHEMEMHQYGVGGKPWRVVAAERAARDAQRAAGNAQHAAGADPPEDTAPAEEAEPARKAQP